MEIIGVILIVGGFILGIFAGLTMSRHEVLIDEKGGLKKSKQFQISVLAGASSIAMIIGFVLFFGGF